MLINHSLEILKIRKKEKNFLPKYSDLGAFPKSFFSLWNFFKKQNHTDV